MRLETLERFKIKKMSYLLVSARPSPPRSKKLVAPLHLFSFLKEIIIFISYSGRLTPNPLLAGSHEEVKKMKKYYSVQRSEKAELRILDLNLQLRTIFHKSA